jgi:phosphate transport system permease protein
LLNSLIALLIAVPVRFGIALFLTGLSLQPLKDGPLGTAIELLAAVPSIVYGACCWSFGPTLADCMQQPGRKNPVDWRHNNLWRWCLGPPVGIGILLTLFS